VKRSSPSDESHCSAATALFDPKRHESLADLAWDASRARAEHGQRKCSLWTGDLGLALYLADRLRVSHESLDVF
jgi:hypothetical protein